MVWTSIRDDMLCCKILVMNPFTGTKKGTVARGTKWEQVAENLNKVELVHFKVDKRSVRDRYNHLANILRKKLSDEIKESGIDPEMTDIEHALEELIEIEDAAKTDQGVVNEQKNREINQDRENAEDIRKTAMEKLGQTKKRKAEDGEESKWKRRSTGSETLNFLRVKNERVQEMQREEIELQRNQLELETRKQDNFMAVMVHQQQQQQSQMQDFTAMMATQMKQQSDMMLALLSKLAQK